MVSENDHECAPRELSELSLGDGGLVIYDPGNHRAWLQSDAPVDPRART